MLFISYFLKNFLPPPSFSTRDRVTLIGQHSINEVKEPEIEIFAENAEDKILNIFGDKNAKVYYLD